MKFDRLYREVPVENHLGKAVIEDHQLDPTKSVWEQRDKFMWGTYGKNREHSLRWKRLVSLTTEHLQNILKTEGWVNPLYNWLISHELEERKNPVPKDLFEL